MSILKWPEYQCHKKVRAVKIEDIEFRDSGAAIIKPEDPGIVPFTVTPGYVQKHQPVIGGYVVSYLDGYLSFSPAGPFESGYTKL